VYDYIKAILGSEKNGYVINSRVLCAADYGAPQKRMRFVLIGIKRDISDKAVFPNGQYDEDEYRTVRDAIGDLEDIDPVFDLEDDIGMQLPRINIEGLGAALRNSNVLHNHIATKTTEIALERFRAIKQGQNFHSLDDSLKTNTYTDAARTQNTIYLRLNYDEPSGTVVNVRKSMWIHPVKDRAVSVREVARLQSFPDSYIFKGTKDELYQQIGNAVPPLLARAVAERLLELLGGTIKFKLVDILK
jgi:DNA (cytosine-5)-methyltransferase 1